MNTHRFLATFAIFLFTSVTLAQTNTGQIKGVLRDHSRAVIPGANVTATNVATGLTVARVTDSAGEFVFPSLAVGEWTISAAASGFKHLVKPGVILQLGQVVDLELQLEVGEVTVTEMVTVMSAGQILQTATGEVSDVFGGKAAALINVASKSGGAKLHGNLFEFIRNEKLDAKNFFDDPNKPIPPYKQNQFGGTLGGPIKIPRIYTGHDRTFFFARYEGQRIRQSFTKTFSVPTLAMRNGDLSAFGQLFDPLTTDPSGNRQPIVNNRIPQERMDPVALGLLARIPLPNLPGISRNLLATEIERTNLDQYSLRIDHQATANDNVFARLSIFDARAFQPFGSGKLFESLLPGFGRDLTTKSYNLALSHTHSFTPDILNEFRFGYLNVSGGQRSENRGVDFASTVGLLGTTSVAEDLGFPLVGFGGLFSNFGDPTSFVTRDNTSRLEHSGG